jgi:Ca2+-binding EF-hand superfamily protein
MSGSDEEKIKLIFFAFDDDGNGILSYKEFKNATKKFASHLDKNEVENLVKKVWKIIRF